MPCRTRRSVLNRTGALLLCLVSSVASPLFAQGQNRTWISALPAKPTPSPTDQVPIIDAAGNAYRAPASAFGTGSSTSFPNTVNLFKGTGASLGVTTATPNVDYIVPNTTGTLSLTATGPITITPGGANLISFKQSAFKDSVSGFTLTVDTSQLTGNRRVIASDAGDMNLPVPFTAGATKKLSAFKPDGTFSDDYIYAMDVVPTEVVVGDANTTISNTGAVSSIKLSTTLSTTRQFTFPNTDNYAAGDPIRFYSSVDSAGNIARVISAYGNTFNGSSSVDITEAFFNRVFVADPVSHNWTVSTFGGTTGSGLSNGGWQTVSLASGIATLNCSPSYTAQNFIVSLTANATLAFANAFNGAGGKIKFRQDGTGGRTVATPAGTKTPGGRGGALTVSSGVNAETECLWDFDGQYYNITPIGLDYAAATSSTTYNTVVDDTTTGQSTSGQTTQGDVTGKKYRAFKIGAAAANDTIGKCRFIITKVGSPTYNLYGAFVTDNGSGMPSLLSTGQIGSVSDAVPASAIATATNVDFNPLANRTAGTTYWLVIYGDNAAADAANYYQIAYHTVTGTTGVQILAQSSNGNTGSWTGSSTTAQGKFVTYKSP